MKRVKIVTIVMFIIAFCSLSLVYGTNGIRNVAEVTGGGTIGRVTKLADRIAATAITIIQVIAVGCVVFAGLRYMYASADKKADIKKGMMYLAIGAIFVFAATTVIRFIYSAGSSLL